MFTGIVQSVGTIRSWTPSQDSILEIEISDLTWTKPHIDIGESIAVNGVCLTALESPKKDILKFFVSKETIQKTNLFQRKIGDRVNLERALKAEDRLSGHWVLGHVDGICKLIEKVPSDQGIELTWILEKPYGKYCAPKGSIAIDGVSLTLNKVIDLTNGDTQISCMIIPHTWNNTHFFATIGQTETLPTKTDIKSPIFFNFEADSIAKTLERLYEYQYRFKS